MSQWFSNLTDHFPHDYNYIIICELPKLYVALYLHADDSDYRLSANSAVIYIGESEACVTVYISDDQFIEDTEYFTLIPSSFNPNDIVVGSTTVMISDNDGMCDSTTWLTYCSL